jgi:hypothetical protein
MKPFTDCYKNIVQRCELEEESLIDTLVLQRRSPIIMNSIERIVSSIGDYTAN